MPSHANFILFKIGRDVRPVRESCRQKGVLVGRAFPPLDTWLRLSIGTMEEMERRLPRIREVLQ